MALRKQCNFAVELWWKKNLDILSWSELKKFAENPEDFDKGTTQQIEAFYERALVLNFEDEKLPRFFGNCEKFQKARERQAENMRLLEDMKRQWQYPSC